MDAAAIPTDGSSANVGPDCEDVSEASPDNTSTNTGGRSSSGAELDALASLTESLDSGNNATASSEAGISQAGDRCLFKTIPAEIRNRIYELAFKLEDDHGRVSEDLDEAEPPGKAIILTCRQFFVEAKHMYAVMAREFWSTGKFIVRMGALVEVEEEFWERDFEEYWDKSYKTDVAKVSEFAIAHVKRLKMVYEHSDMQFEKGVWYQGSGHKYDSVCWAIVPEATWKRYCKKPNPHVERRVTSKKIRIGEGHFMKLKCSGQYKGKFEGFIVNIGEGSLTKAKILGMMRGG